MRTNSHVRPVAGNALKRRLNAWDSGPDGFQLVPNQPWSSQYERTGILNDLDYMIPLIKPTRPGLRFEALSPFVRTHQFGEPNQSSLSHQFGEPGLCSAPYSKDLIATNMSDRCSVGPSFRPV